MGGAGDAGTGGWGGAVGGVAVGGGRVQFGQDGFEIGQGGIGGFFGEHVEDLGFEVVDDAAASARGEVGGDEGAFDGVEVASRRARTSGLSVTVMNHLLCDRGLESDCGGGGVTPARVSMEALTWRQWASISARRFDRRGEAVIAAGRAGRRGDLMDGDEAVIGEAAEDGIEGGFGEGEAVEGGEFFGGADSRRVPRA